MELGWGWGVWQTDPSKFFPSPKASRHSLTPSPQSSGHTLTFPKNFPVHTALDFSTSRRYRSLRTPRGTLHPRTPMAGRPISRQQLKHIISLGEEGEETILSMLASGSTVKDVAEWLGFPRNSLYALYKWRDETPERQAAWRQALAHRSQSLAEESMEIADEAREDVDALRKAEMRIKVRQWLAGVSDPENYGKDKAAKLTINVATMHLTAVESVNRELQERAILKLRGGDPSALPAPAVPDADYEILDDAPEDVYADDTPADDDLDLLDML